MIYCFKTSSCHEYDWNNAYLKLNNNQSIKPFSTTLFNLYENFLLPYFTRLKDSLIWFLTISLIPLMSVLHPVPTSGVWRHLIMLKGFIDHMLVAFTTTYTISAYHHWCCEFESRSGRGVQHYVIKFVSDLLVGVPMRTLKFFI